MNVNLEYYRIFYYVANAGSFTLAGETLNISQPAVSQAIKLLEATLGSKLFVRIPKGVRLTPEGEMLFRYVKRGYEYIQTGEVQFQKMLDLENGEIRIGASDMTLQYYLLPYLEKFHEKYPKIKFTVTNAPTPETIEYLYQGKIDFGVVSEPFHTRPEIETTRVREIQDTFVAGKRFNELKDQVLEYGTLTNLPCILLEETTSTRRYLNDFLLDNDVVLKPEFELAMSDIIVDFAKRNLGIGCVVKDFALKGIEEGKLFELTFQKPIPKRHFSIITSKQNPISTAAQELLDMLAQAKDQMYGTE